MAGSVINRGGVKFEFLPDLEREGERYRASMRNHWGRGPSFLEAADDLLSGIESELVVAKAARAGLLAGLGKR